MKKINPISELSYSALKKNFLIMRNIAILLFLGIMQVYAVENKIISIPDYLTEILSPQQKQISGTVKGKDGTPLPGVNVIVTGTSQGVITDIEGKYTLNLPQGAKSLTFSFIGMEPQEIAIGTLTQVNVNMAESAVGLEEVVVIGYGTQKRSDITGTVASLPQERLEIVPNINIAQAIQGAIPGVMIQTTSAGAAAEEVILIRGRKSVEASNEPLIVVDGIPYSGMIRDININDVKSIEILKDASAAAIYGSRGSNGVILITTKEGVEGKVTVSYNGFYSVQNFVNLPEILNGEEFYEYKMAMSPQYMSLPELDVYESGDWTDYYDLCLRTGTAQQHNISASGGTRNAKYYVSGGVSDVKGIAVNDDYLRLSNRINIEMDINSWLTLGTRTQFSYDDRSGEEPDFSDAHTMNPLTRGLNEDGSINIYPWEGRESFYNPLEATLYDNIDKSSQVITNNFAVINFPFIEGLSYRINTGFRFRYSESATYRGRNTGTGRAARGSSDTKRSKNNNTVIENILTYKKEIGKHSIFATGIYSFEGDNGSSNALEASGFPNDFLTWFASAQADLVSPEYTISESNLISQMLRFNYTYDKRYLVTLSGRRDGFSGFGAQSKWGIFPSLALGWNFHNESFFPFTELFNELKLRASYGLNGNQAVGVYKSITRLEEFNLVDAGQSVAGYIPSILGDSNLGWESSLTLNIGLDYGILDNRFSGTINVYKTNTSDLLLDRTISPTHGITSIISNIGETENRGFEFSVNSRNISTSSFTWVTSGNIAFLKNKIVSLYGILDDEGQEVDDITNRWFIGQPVRVNYDFKITGVWQLDEAEEAAKWNSRPGYIKYEDVNGDYKLDANDMQILGQNDPKFLWGLTNTFSYKNLNLNVYLHGVHGVTCQNSLMEHTNGADARGNVTKKNYWTPENPTNDYPMLYPQSHVMAGVNATNRWYENASFVRIKDVSISYNLQTSLLERIGLNNLRIYIAGKNLFTFTDYNGLDPELASHILKGSPTHGIPMQREYIFGLDFAF